MEDLKKIISKEGLSEWTEEIKEILVSLFFDEIPIPGNKATAEGEPDSAGLSRGNNERSYSSLHPEMDESKLEELEEVNFSFTMSNCSYSLKRKRKWNSTLS